MDDGCLGCLIPLAIAGGIIYIIVKYVIPILLAASAAILAVFAAIGAVVGLVKAIINVTRAIKYTVSERKSLRRQSLVDGRLWDGGTPVKELFFEDVASKAYLFGPCFADVWSIIKKSFSNNFGSHPDFTRGDRWFTRVLFVMWSVFELLATYVLGTAGTVALSLILLTVFLALELPVLIAAGIVLLFEKIFYLSKRISYRCPKCKYEYTIPVYICPNSDCQIKHRRLRPGVYGIIRRRCVCGDVAIPLTASIKGRYIGKYRSRKEKIKFSELSSRCPQCGEEYNAGLTKPTSIALVGGAAAGKTTFKVAFGYSFLDEEAVRMGLDFGFPDKRSEDEYEKSVRYYKGLDIIPETNRGSDTDISTFSFSLENKKFSASRMIQIYDMPGEVFATEDAKEGWRNYQFTEGMVFLIDPFSLPAVKDKHQKEVSSGSMGVCTMDMNALIDSLINTLQNEKVKKNKGKFAIPVALTINKVDSGFLKKMCGSEAVEALMSGCPEVFSDYFAAMDYVCRCFLVKNDGIGFITNLDNNFNTVHFFFSSPMGYIPQASRTRFRPINVLPIMQWMMLRADSELAKVWKPDHPVIDLTDEQRELYKTHPEYYDKYVMELLNEGDDNNSE